MSEKAKGGFDLIGLFIKDAADDDKPTSEAVTATTPASAAPSLLSTMTIGTGAAAPTSTGPSARALEMLAAAQKQIPADNAQLKLDAAMESIKAIEPDATRRRNMALAILGSQGVSADLVEADADKARAIMSDTITALSTQLTAKRENGVDNVRANATSLREQATALEAEITKIREQQSKLNSEAGELESKATVEENNLNGLAADIEAALAIINSGAK